MMDPAVVTRAPFSWHNGGMSTAACLWVEFIGSVRKQPPETEG
jgi:hypothetical protein